MPDVSLLRPVITFSRREKKLTKNLLGDTCYTTSAMCQPRHIPHYHKDASAFRAFGRWLLGTEGVAG